MAVDKLVDSSQLNSDLTSVANAIRTKGGTSGSLAFPSGFVSAIQNIPSGGGTTDPGLVRFADYDGTIVATYTAAEFAELNALPSNPSHTGLTAQGWNWSLSDAKTYVAAHKHLDIGQSYVTSDGKTRIYISITNSLHKTINLCWRQDTSYGVSIDWGDGNTSQPVSGTGSKNETHEYSAVGDYVIALTVETGKLDLGNGSSSTTIFGAQASNRIELSYITHVELGEDLYSPFFGTYTFSGCGNLQSISIPTGDITSIQSDFLSYCSSLKCIILPAGVTSVSVISGNCISLEYISLPKSLTYLSGLNYTKLKRIILPESVTTINQLNNNMYLETFIAPSSTISISSSTLNGNRRIEKLEFGEVTSVSSSAFSACYGLRSISISNGLPTIPTSMLNACYSLKDITIPNSYTSIGDSAFSYTDIESFTMPNTVETIGINVFGYCGALKSITLSNKLTSIPNQVFSGCYCLKSIVIPNTVKSIGNSAFSSCYSLEEVTLSNTLESIGNSAFHNNRSLKSISIPNTVTSIGTSAFYNCYSLVNVNIPNTITTIPKELFDTCQSIIAITIPSTVTTIDTKAFRNLNALRELHVLPTTPPSIASDTFYNLPSNCVIYVPYSADHSVLTAYQTATNWSVHASKMQEEPQ